jgi:hypothetical protein
MASFSFLTSAKPSSRRIFDVSYTISFRKILSVDDDAAGVAGLAGSSASVTPELAVPKSNAAAVVAFSFFSGFDCSKETATKADGHDGVAVLRGAATS